MADYKTLEQRVEKVEERNSRVEIDKAWETSTTRRTLIFLFTYVAVGLYLLAINVPKPFLNAIIPAVGFGLSTLVLPVFKRLWLKHFRKS